MTRSRPLTFPLLVLVLVAIAIYVGGRRSPSPIAVSTPSGPATTDVTVPPRFAGEPQTPALFTTDKRINALQDQVAELFRRVRELEAERAKGAGR